MGRGTVVDSHEPPYNIEDFSLFLSPQILECSTDLRVSTGLSCHALPWTCDRFATDPLGLSRIGRYPGTLWEVV